MLLAYAVDRNIIVALDNKVSEITINFKNSKQKLLKTFTFFQTDFVSIDFETTEKILILEIQIAKKIIRRKIIFN